MSLENFCVNLDKQLRALKADRDKAYGSAKGALTRKIHELEAYLHRATRKGIQ